MHSIKWRHCRWCWVTLTTQISTSCIAFYIFVVNEHKDFKFVAYVEHSNFQHTTDKHALKGVWSNWSCYHKDYIPPPKRVLLLIMITWPIIIFVPQISLQELKLETSTFVHWVVCEVFALGLQIVSQLSIQHTEGSLAINTMTQCVPLLVG